MDDEKLFGKNFHKLGFGEAIQKEILCNYQVIIQHVDVEQARHILDDSYFDAELRKSNNNADNDDEIIKLLDNGARMIDCWNALRKHGEANTFAENEPPARRAVAFSNRIAQSKSFEKHFPTVIQRCQEHQENNGGQSLECETKHVDGTQLSRDRADALQWLRDEPADGQCKILTNARCLTEGIDVPALDAVLFLQPRESVVDVVQAVGRVMRKSEGKEIGYIIIPIVIAKGKDGSEALNSSVYQTVWQVINAIKAHDDRFAVVINQLAIEQKDYLQQKDIGQENQQTPTDNDQHLQTHIQFVNAPAVLKKLLLAKIVNTYSDRKYWDRWISTTHEVIQQVTDKLNNLKQQPQSKPILDRFFKALENNIQGMPPSEEDAIEMLALHYVSKPVFDHLFHTTSPLSDALNAVIHDLKPYGLTEELESLQPLFWQAQLIAKDAPSNAAKQKILIHFYENYFRRMIPRKVQSLGIAYSPIEAVDYILHAVQDLLIQHWSKTLGSPGIQIIEPFAGTGTFLARLIADKSLISDAELDFKYENEIFGNEILPLAYYAAQANIAAAFKERTGIAKPFRNL